MKKVESACAELLMSSVRRPSPKTVPDNPSSLDRMTSSSLLVRVTFHSLVRIVTTGKIRGEHLDSAASWHTSASHLGVLGILRRVGATVRPSPYLERSKPGSLRGAQGALAMRRSCCPGDALSPSCRVLKSWMAFLFWYSIRAMVMTAFQHFSSPGHRKSISLLSVVTMVK